MKYGKDYGIKVDVPWYVKCPLINRLSDTCLCEISIDTFDSAGRPMRGSFKKVRLPIKKHVLHIHSRVSLSVERYSAEKCSPIFGYGIHFYYRLLDVNHKKVLSCTDDCTLVGSTIATPKEEPVYFGENISVDVKFGNRDFYYL